MDYNLYRVYYIGKWKQPGCDKGEVTGRKQFCRIYNKWSWGDADGIWNRFGKENRCFTNI